MISPTLEDIEQTNLTCENCLYKLTYSCDRIATFIVTNENPQKPTVTCLIEQNKQALTIDNYKKEYSTCTQHTLGKLISYAILLPTNIEVLRNTKNTTIQTLLNFRPQILEELSTNEGIKQREKHEHLKWE